MSLKSKYPPTVVSHISVAATDTFIILIFFSELDDKFDYCKTLMLIDEYRKRQERFSDDVTRADSLYKEIEQVFHAEGYTGITAVYCSRRMAYLSTEFRRRYDMVTRLTGSGSAARNWKYYNVMSRLQERSVVLEPQRLVAFGSSTMNSVRVQQNVVPEKRSSRKRPTPTQKKSNSSAALSLNEFRQQKLQLGFHMVASAEKLASLTEPNNNTYDEDNDFE